MTTAKEPVKEKGSFRDPSGHIFYEGGRVLRTISQRARDKYEYVRGSAFIKECVEQGRIIASTEITRENYPSEFVSEDIAYIVEHPKLSFVSYPYEWCFSMLKDAALAHLDLQIDTLAHGAALSDASAYNIQFVGTRPLFIDLLSLRPYIEGEFWIGHNQFCEQFLNPLLLTSLFDVPFNEWYRGRQEGISTEALSRLIPLTRKIRSLGILSHIVLPDRAQNAARKHSTEKLNEIGKRTLKKSAYAGMLRQLRKWISTLEQRKSGATVWSEYEVDNTYTEAGYEEKRSVVEKFVREFKPRKVWDVGCNAGEYAQLALAAGAANVVGFEFDFGALEIAYARAKENRLNFTPLYLNALNPSPNQGWNEQERHGLNARANADALLALAFEHHLAIAGNVPLPEVVKWLVGLAPRGIVEFIPKEDPTIQKMLAVREDIFDNYSEKFFVEALQRTARVQLTQRVSDTGRTLYIFERN